MPRKRSVYPGFNRDERIAALSPWARLLYVGLWGQMDKQGLVEDDPRLIKADIFTLDPHSLSEIEGFRDELLKVGPDGRPCLVRLKWRAKTLLFCPTFIHRQKIYADEPQRFKVPEAFLVSVRAQVDSGQTLPFYEYNAAPQPGTGPDAGLVLVPTQDTFRPSASPSASTSTSASASPRGDAASDGDNSSAGGLTEEQELAEAEIHEALNGGHWERARHMILALPWARRTQFLEVLDVTRQAEVRNAL